MWNASRFCMSSLRRGHANLLCIVPIFSICTAEASTNVANFDFVAKLKYCTTTVFGSRSRTTSPDLIRIKIQNRIRLKIKTVQYRLCRLAKSNNYSISRSKFCLKS
jgi:hypothetical protein